VLADERLHKLKGTRLTGNVLGSLAAKSMVLFFAVIPNDAMLSPYPVKQPSLGDECECEDFLSS